MSGVVSFLLDKSLSFTLEVCPVLTIENVRYPGEKGKGIHKIGNSIFNNSGRWACNQHSSGPGYYNIAETSFI